MNEIYESKKVKGSAKYLQKVTKDGNFGKEIKTECELTEYTVFILLYK